MSQLTWLTERALGIENTADRVLSERVDDACVCDFPFMGEWDCLIASDSSSSAASVDNSYKTDIFVSKDVPGCLQSEVADGFSLKKMVWGHWDDTQCLAVDTKIDRVITGADNNMVKVWCLSTGELLNVCIGHLDSIQDVLIDDKSGIIVTDDVSGVVRVWTKDGELQSTFSHTSCFSISKIQFVKDDREFPVLFVCSDMAVLRYDLNVYIAEVVAARIEAISDCIQFAKQYILYNLTPETVSHEPIDLPSQYIPPARAPGQVQVALEQLLSKQLIHEHYEVQGQTVQLPRLIDSVIDSCGGRYTLQEWACIIPIHMVNQYTCSDLKIPIPGPTLVLPNLFLHAFMNPLVRMDCIDKRKLYNEANRKRRTKLQQVKQGLEQLSWAPPTEIDITVALALDPHSLVSVDAQHVVPDAFYRNIDAKSVVLPNTSDSKQALPAQSMWMQLTPCGTELVVVYELTEGSLLCFLCSTTLTCVSTIQTELRVSHQITITQVDKEVYVAVVEEASGKTHVWKRQVSSKVQCSMKLPESQLHPFPKSNVYLSSYSPQAVQPSTLAQQASQYGIGYTHKYFNYRATMLSAYKDQQIPVYHRGCVCLHDQTSAYTTCIETGPRTLALFPFNKNSRFGVDNELVWSRAVQFRQALIHMLVGFKVYPLVEYIQGRHTREFKEVHVVSIDGNSIDLVEYGCSKGIVQNDQEASTDAMQIGKLRIISSDHVSNMHTILPARKKKPQYHDPSCINATDSTTPVYLLSHIQSKLSHAMNMTEDLYIPYCIDADTWARLTKMDQQTLKFRDGAHVATLYSILKTRSESYAYELDEEEIQEPRKRARLAKYVFDDSDSDLEVEQQDKEIEVPSRRAPMTSPPIRNKRQSGYSPVDLQESAHTLIYPRPVSLCFWRKTLLLGMSRGTMRFVPLSASMVHYIAYQSTYDAMQIDPEVLTRTAEHSIPSLSKSNGLQPIFPSITSLGLTPVAIAPHPYLPILALVTAEGYVELYVPSTGRRLARVNKSCTKAYRSLAAPSVVRALPGLAQNQHVALHSNQQVRECQWSDDGQHFILTDEGGGVVYMTFSASTDQDSFCPSQQLISTENTQLATTPWGQAYDRENNTDMQFAPTFMNFEGQAYPDNGAFAEVASPPQNTVQLEESIYTSQLLLLADTAIDPSLVYVYTSQDTRIMYTKTLAVITTPTSSIFVALGRHTTHTIASYYRPLRRLSKSMGLQSPTTFFFEPSSLELEGKQDMYVYFAKFNENQKLAVATYPSTTFHCSSGEDVLYLVLSIMQKYIQQHNKGQVRQYVLQTCVPKRVSILASAVQVLQVDLPYSKIKEYYDIVTENNLQVISLVTAYWRISAVSYASFLTGRSNMSSASSGDTYEQHSTDIRSRFESLLQRNNITIDAVLAYISPSDPANVTCMLLNALLGKQECFETLFHPPPDVKVTIPGIGVVTLKHYTSLPIVAPVVCPMTLAGSVADNGMNQISNARHSDVRQSVPVRSVDENNRFVQPSLFDPKMKYSLDDVFGNDDVSYADKQYQVYMNLSKVGMKELPSKPYIVPSDMQCPPTSPELPSLTYLQTLNPVQQQTVLKDFPSMIPLMVSVQGRSIYHNGAIGCNKPGSSFKEVALQTETTPWRLLLPTPSVLNAAQSVQQYVPMTTEYILRELREPHNIPYSVLLHQQATYSDQQLLEDIKFAQQNALFLEQYILRMCTSQKLSCCEEMYFPRISQSAPPCYTTTSQVLIERNQMTFNTITMDQVRSLSLISVADPVNYSNTTSQQEILLLGLLKDSSSSTHPTELHFTEIIQSKANQQKIVHNLDKQRVLGLRLAKPLTDTQLRDLAAYKESSTEEIQNCDYISQLCNTQASTTQVKHALSIYSYMYTMHQIEKYPYMKHKYSSEMSFLASLYSKEVVSSITTQARTGWESVSILQSYKPYITLNDMCILRLASAPRVGEVPTAQNIDILKLDSFLRANIASLFHCIVEIPSQKSKKKALPKKQHGRKRRVIDDSEDSEYVEEELSSEDESFSSLPYFDAFPPVLPAVAYNIHVNVNISPLNNVYRGDFLSTFVPNSLQTISSPQNSESVEIFPNIYSLLSTRRFYENIGQEMVGNAIPARRSQDQESVLMEEASSSDEDIDENSNTVSNNMNSSSSNNSNSNNHNNDVYEDENDNEYMISGSSDSTGTSSEVDEDEADEEEEDSNDDRYTSGSNNNTSRSRISRNRNANTSNTNHSNNRSNTRASNNSNNNTRSRSRGKTRSIRNETSINTRRSSRRAIVVEEDVLTEDEGTTTDDDDNDDDDDDDDDEEEEEVRPRKKKVTAVARTSHTAASKRAPIRRTRGQASQDDSDYEEESNTTASKRAHSKYTSSNRAKHDFILESSTEEELDSESSDVEDDDDEEDMVDYEKVRKTSQKNDKNNRKNTTTNNNTNKNKSKKPVSTELDLLRIQLQQQPNTVYSPNINDVQSRYQIGMHCIFHTFLYTEYQYSNKLAARQYTHNDRTADNQASLLEYSLLDSYLVDSVNIVTASREHVYITEDDTATDQSMTTSATLACYNGEEMNLEYPDSEREDAPASKQNHNSDTEDSALDRRRRRNITSYHSHSDEESQEDLPQSSFPFPDVSNLESSSFTSSSKTVLKGINVPPVPPNQQLQPQQLCVITSCNVLKYKQKLEFGTLLKLTVDTVGTPVRITYTLLLTLDATQVLTPLYTCIFVAPTLRYSLPPNRQMWPSNQNYPNMNDLLHNYYKQGDILIIFDGIASVRVCKFLMYLTANKNIVKLNGIHGTTLRLRKHDDQKESLLVTFDDQNEEEMNEVVKAMLKQGEVIKHNQEHEKYTSICARLSKLNKMKVSRTTRNKSSSSSNNLDTVPLRRALEYRAKQILESRPDVEKELELDAEDIMIMEKYNPELCALAPWHIIHRCTSRSLKPSTKVNGPAQNSEDTLFKYAHPSEADVLDSLDSTVQDYMKTTVYSENRDCLNLLDAVHTEVPHNIFKIVPKNLQAKFASTNDLNSTYIKSNKAMHDGKQYSPLPRNPTMPLFCALLAVLLPYKEVAGVLPICKRLALHYYISIEQVLSEIHDIIINNPSLKDIVLPIRDSIIYILSYILESEYLDRLNELYLTDEFIQLYTHTKTRKTSVVGLYSQTSGQFYENKNQQLNLDIETARQILTNDILSHAL